MEHPVITNMERTGTPDGRQERYPICPVCERECETVMKDVHGQIVGCNECLKTCDAWDEAECFEEE